MKTVKQDGFHPLTTQLSDYYEIEVSYTRSDKDILILVRLLTI